MKYKNNPAEPLEKGEMLQFVQQLWIWAGSLPQKADESGNSRKRQMRGINASHFPLVTRINVSGVESHSSN
ncbi:hypothetical protein [Paenibacillus sp. FSL R10-2736]|uniref:hypothetical protein n=1 Tax=Paenibacillus sp. FSL R10-2736 TaxID=2954692 RepID=UPI0030F8E8D5